MTTRQAPNLHPPSNSTDEAAKQKLASEDCWDFEAAYELSVSKLLDGDLCDTELNEIAGLFVADAGGNEVIHQGSSTAAILDAALAFGSKQHESSNTTSSPTRVSEISNASNVTQPQEKRSMKQGQRTSSQSKRRKVVQAGNSTASVNGNHHHQQQTHAVRLFGKSVSLSSSTNSFQQPGPILPRTASMNAEEKPATQEPGMSQSASNASITSTTSVASKQGQPKASTKGSNAAKASTTKSSNTNPLTANKKFKDGVSLSDEAEALVEATSAKMDIQLPEVTVSSSASKDGTAASASASASAEEMHRNRNREHARNTRLRKKAYIDALKQTLNDLTEQRDETMKQEEVKFHRDYQNRQVRFQVMQAFLDLLRGNTSESDRSSDYPRWVAILEDIFVLSTPMATAEKVYSGISEVRDGFTNGISLSPSKPGTTNTAVIVSYTCDRDTLLMDGCKCVIEWSGTATSIGNRANTCGLTSDITITGTLRAQFDSDTNKLHSARLMYDSGALHRNMEK